MQAAPLVRSPQCSPCPPCSHPPTWTPNVWRSSPNDSTPSRPSRPAIRKHLHETRLTHTHNRKEEKSVCMGSQHTSDHTPPSWHMPGCTETKCSRHRHTQRHIHNHRQHNTNLFIHISPNVCIRTRTKCDSSCNASHHRH